MFGFEKEIPLKLGSLELSSLTQSLPLSLRLQSLYPVTLPVCPEVYNSYGFVMYLMIILNFVGFISLQILFGLMFLLYLFL